MGFVLINPTYCLVLYFTFIIFIVTYSVLYGKFYWGEFKGLYNRFYNSNLKQLKIIILKYEYVLYLS